MARGEWKKNKRLERLSKARFWQDVRGALEGLITSEKTLLMCEKLMAMPENEQAVIERACLTLCHNTLLAPLQALEVVHEIGRGGWLEKGANG